MTSKVPLTESRDEDLCVACGLCCTGELYGRVPLEPEEVALAEGWGLPVIYKESGGAGVMEPCPCHQDGKCSIYDQRFRVCREYKCSLLRRFESGEASYAESIEKVEAVKTLIAQLKSALSMLPVGDPGTLEESVAAVLEVEPSADGAPLRNEVVLTYGAVALMLNRHWDSRHHAMIVPGQRSAEEMSAKEELLGV